MKKLMFKIGVIAVILLTAFPLIGQTSKVSQQTAEQVARTFWNLHHDGDVAKLNTPMHCLDTPWDAFYIFAPAEGKGFVIVAADDRVCPVLAYSFHNNAMRDKMSPSMSWWLDGWQQQVDELRKEKGGERNEEWQQLKDGGGTPRSLTVVAPMITTQWDQGAPYNDYCPDDPEDGRALTGCVATAMAQVMKYWNYPERGTGTHTYNSVSINGLGHSYGVQTANFGATVYDWDNMPNSLTMASPDVQKAAVATLMYHCGVACDMYYGSSFQGGSGSQIINIPYLKQGNALNGVINYFGYSSSATGVHRIKYDDNAWMAMLRGELDGSRPVIYGALSSYSGHCFVCDGYDDENRYHFNWGWSGEGDGFFTLNSLTPTVGSYTYNYNGGQQMMLGMQPHTADDTLCIIRHFPYTEDFETAPTGWAGSASNIRASYLSWIVVDSIGVDGNYSAGVFQTFFSESDDHMFSPSIVTPGDYKVNWQACAKNASGSDSYTLTVGTETFDDTVESTTWQPRELLFSVAEGDTVRLDFGHTTRTNSIGVLIDNVVIEQMSNDYTITVSANPSNGGTVAGGGIYQQGQSCTVTATPAAGYTFVRWTENGTQVSTNANYTFTVTSNRTLVAQFQAQTYTITATANPTDGGSVTGGGTYNYGQSCTLTAIAASGYNFVRWTKNGTQVSTNPTYTFNVTESAAFVAHFEIQSYTVSVSANPTSGGTVAGGGTYNQGQVCTVTATANTGYDFVNWTESGNVVSTNASYSFTVTGNHTLVANFALQTFVVSTAVEPAEGGTATGAGTYNYGDEVTISVETNEDWAFQNWTENGTVVAEDKTFTFVATANRNFVANLLYTEGVGEQIGNNLILYPNPVNDKLTVEAQEAIGTVEIYNLMGAVVCSQKNCGTKVEINTVDLQSGIYFIRLTNDKVSETRKFVKE